MDTENFDPVMFKKCTGYCCNHTPLDTTHQNINPNECVFKLDQDNIARFDNEWGISNLFAQGDIGNYAKSVQHEDKLIVYMLGKK